jgi:hypothetical protein
MKNVVPWEVNAVWPLRTDISEKTFASNIRLRIGELGTTLEATSNQSTPLTQAHIVYLRSVLRLLVTANVFPSSPTLFTSMMEVMSSSEASVLTRTTWHNIPKDGIRIIEKNFEKHIYLLNAVCEFV